MQVIKYKDDYDLVHRYLTGDDSAGHILFAKVYPILQGFVINETKDSIINDSDRDDIILDTLKIAVEKLNIYTGNSKFSTLVVGIGKKKISEKYRKLGLNKEKLVDIDTFIDIDSMSTIDLIGRSPLEIIIEKEEKEAVLKAISILDPEYRQILELRLLNDMPFKQMAEISGKSEAALDSMFRRAVKSLKKIFEEIYN